MSLRKLKYHEQKLLKKVDFLQWKSDQVSQRVHRTNPQQTVLHYLNASRIGPPSIELTCQLCCAVLPRCCGAPIQNVRETRILRRYHIQRKEDYTKSDQLTE